MANGNRTAPRVQLLHGNRPHLRSGQHLAGWRLSIGNPLKFRKVATDPQDLGTFSLRPSFSWQNFSLSNAFRFASTWPANASCNSKTLRRVRDEFSSYKTPGNHRVLVLLVPKPVWMLMIYICDCDKVFTFGIAYAGPRSNSSFGSWDA